MRKALLSISFVLAACVASAQVKPVENAAEVLQAKETSFDFGRIPQGRPVNHIFKVSNAGKEPLVIENVQATCGCTTPEWSREPIAPGATAEIKVGYNSASEGPFEKSISIMYGKGQTKSLVIKGTVWKTPSQAELRNSSISLLKNVN